MSSTIFTGKSALITGASAGLGEEFARQLAQWGASHLILTARRNDRLLKLKAALSGEHPGLRVDLLTADLAAPGGVAGLISDLERQNLAPDMVINNAGFGDLGIFESSDPAKIEAMLALNVTALTLLTRWAVNPMLAKKSGWICNVGSTAGLLPLPSFAVYGATKAYVNSFSEALRAELHGSGVFVTALLPGPVETEFGQVASRANSHRRFAPPPFLCVDKADVVRETLYAMARGQGRLIPGFPVRFPMLFVESTPRWLLRFIFNLSSGGFRRERQSANQP
ncbi:MAG TPA: SDR family oxidoreductase [Candidatus Methylacidiphilales bacterium]|nr:SDR family oxidoreductase [Candidatus Methylacidiphilales bacterium]